MGGWGSGRGRRFGTKDTTDDYRSIDVRHWQRDGLLTPGQAFGWNWSRDGESIASIQVRTEPNRVFLMYRHRSGNEEWKDKSYPVLLSRTSCNLGGERPWFICPADGCGRRVAILYIHNIFACRHCLQLAYSSQREPRDERASRRADKLREKLEWEPGILNGKGWKPKGMHWRTYERLTAEHDAFVAVSLAGIAHRLHVSKESVLNRV